MAGDIGFVVSAPPAAPTTTTTGATPARRSPRHEPAARTPTTEARADHAPRLPEQLKSRIEDAAAREGFSVNTWLTRAVTRGLESGDAEASTGRRREPLVRPALLRLGPLTPALATTHSRARGPGTTTTVQEVATMPTFDTPTPSRSASTSPAARSGSARATAPTPWSRCAPEQRAQLRRPPGRRPDPGRVRRGELTVTSPRRPRLLFFGSMPSVVIELVVPEGSGLEAALTAGDVDCEGRLGDVRIDNRYGDIRIDRAATCTPARRPVTSPWRTSTGTARPAPRTGRSGSAEAAGTLRLDSACGDITVDARRRPRSAADHQVRPGPGPRRRPADRWTSTPPTARSRPASGRAPRRGWTSRRHPGRSGTC